MSNRTLLIIVVAVAVLVTAAVYMHRPRHRVTPHVIDLHGTR